LILKGHSKLYSTVIYTVYLTVESQLQSLYNALTMEVNGANFLRI